MTTPLVFRSPARRVFWVEQGVLWTFSRVSWRWWPVVGPSQLIGGQALTESERLELIAECGSPARPRVTAEPGHCIVCGRPVSPGGAGVYFGARGPFCTLNEREAWFRSQPVIDARLSRG